MKILPSELPGVLKKLISFLSTHTRHLAAGAGILLLLILGWVLLGSLVGAGRQSADDGAGAPGDQTLRTLIPPEEAFLPNERERLLEIEEERYREPRTPWEEELVEEFWNPVRETAIEALTEESRREIDELFEEVE